MPVVRPIPWATPGSFHEAARIIEFDGSLKSSFSAESEFFARRRLLKLLQGPVGLWAEETRRLRRRETTQPIAGC